jgi:hypothetical protein
MSKPSTTLNKSQNQEHWLPCPRCTTDTLHKVTVSVDSEEVDSDGISYIRTNWSQCQIVACLGCRNISFRINEWDESCESNEDGQFRGNEQLYPYRIRGRRELGHRRLIPSTIRTLHKETLSALSCELKLLASAGIRSIIEAICKERNAKGGNLEKKISDLVEQSVLAPSGAELLHSLRILGNEAVHEAKTVSTQDLLLALDVVEHLINAVYILPSRTIKSSLPRRSASQHIPPHEIHEDEHVEFETSDGEKVSQQVSLFILSEPCEAEPFNGSDALIVAGLVNPRSSFRMVYSKRLKMTWEVATGPIK